jgi:hypothetical protein
MSIAVWKSILGLAKAGAVLVILLSGFLFWSQRREMGKAWAAPDFAPEARPVTKVVASTGNLSIPLGRFQREHPPTEAQPKAEEKPDIVGALAQLGEITSAFVVAPPYEEGGLAPALVWQWKPGQKPSAGEPDVRAIRVGEGLFNRADPRSSLKPVPYKYKFIGCEPDAEHPGWTWFVFDVNCDGKDIQKGRWKLEEPEKEVPKPAEAGPSGPGPISTATAYIGDPLTAQQPKAEEPKTEVKVEEPVAPPVVPPPIVATQEPTGTLLEEQDGVIAPTDEGIDYLQKNYEKILEDTRTQPYRDRDGRPGVRITGISDASVANQFGIMKDDLILAINGVSVGSQAEAVNVVKSELKKKPLPMIKVKIRRRGREITKTFDPRDPAVRRAAQKGFR